MDNDDKDEGEEVPSTDESHEERMERFVARVPCAPALFGPTHLSSLSESNGLVIETVLRSPVPGQEYGCIDMASAKEKLAKAKAATTATPTTTTPTATRDMPELISKENGPASEDTPPDPSSDEYCTSDEENGGEETHGEGKDVNYGVAQLVHRGICTFQEKALNQKDTVNAEAVIMINSEAYELFVMSGGIEDDENGSPIDYPVTVLVTGSDGAEMQRLVEETLSSSRDSVEQRDVQVTARISLTRERFQLVQNGNSFAIQGNRHWPALRIQNDVLQVFSKSGWGVHAVPHSAGTGSNSSGGDSTSGTDDSLEWQLYIMQHKPVGTNN